VTLFSSLKLGFWLGCLGLGLLHHDSDTSQTVTFIKER
jgi:hypothetical protein